MRFLKQLSPAEELVVKAASKGVGTFRLGGFKAEIEALIEAAADMEPERLKLAVKALGLEVK